MTSARISIIEPKPDPVSLDAFLRNSELTVEVRWIDRRRVFLAQIPGAEVIEEGMLLSPCGEGVEPEAAVSDYVRQIAGRRLAIGAYTPSRREVSVPSTLAAP